MKLNIIVFILFSVILLQNKIFAQPQLWEIYSLSNQPFINIVVEKYDQDSLYIKSMNQIIVIHQDSIKYLLKKRESNFGLGFLFGAIIGGILGATSSSSSEGLLSETGTGLSILFGAIIGGLLGGVVGMVAGSDQKFQLEKLNSENKRIILNRLFK